MVNKLILGICLTTFIAVVVIFLSFDNSGNYTGNAVFEENMNIVEENALVHRVIDGDTIVAEFSDGENKTIRLLGIDFPDIDKTKIKKWTDMGLSEELVKKCYHEGTKELENLVVGKRVKVLLDAKEQSVDRYGRILGYVYYNELFLSEYMVEKGYAIVYDPTSPLCTECHNLENKELKQGCLVENL